MKDGMDAVAHVREHGYAILNRFATRDECQALRERMAALVAAFEPSATPTAFNTDRERHVSDAYFLGSGGEIRFFFEKDALLPEGRLAVAKERALNKVGHALHDLDPVFAAFSRGEKIEALVRAFGLEAPLLLQSMYIFKQPGIGGEVNCHQDGSFLYTEPDSLLGIWLALEDTSVDNGCLWVLPGAHREPLRSRFVRKPEGGAGFQVFDDRPWDLDAMVPLEISAGSAIVLHSRLPHRSDRNRSPVSRHAYTLHCIDAASRYPDDNWLQRPPGFPLRGFGVR
jgi:phytanoyl-CoA hydroxylase